MIARRLGNRWLAGVVPEGLVFDLDAGNPASYPGTGNIWYDLSGNGYNGTLTNGVTYSSNNHGIFVFDGTNDYVDAGFASAVRSASVTSEIWIKFSVSQSSKSIMGVHSNSPGGCSLGIHDLSANRIKFHTNSLGSNNGNGILGTAQLNNNAWHCITGTYHGPTKTMKLYVDNVLDKTLGNVAVPVYPSDKNLNVGRWVGGASQYFNGSIAICRIYNRVLSEPEILRNYNAVKDRYI